MSHSATEHARLNRMLGLRTVLLGGAFALYLGLLAVLERIGVPDAVIDYLVVVAVTVVFLGIGIASRTLLASEFFAAGRSVPAVFNGMATAADWISGAMLIGLVGALYAFGQDGLAFVVGLSGGFVLIAVLIAPYLRKHGAYTLPDFFAARFEGPLTRLLGLVVLICCSLAYLAAQIHAAGLIGELILGIDFEIAVAAGLVVIVVSTLLGGMRAVTWTQCAQYVVLLAAVLVPAVVLSVNHYGFPIPQLAYGQTLQTIAEIEAALAAETPAGPSYLTPFAAMTPLTVFGVVLCLAAGAASLPHILMRFGTTRSVRDARRSANWTLVFVAAVLLTLPAYAAFAKLEVYTQVVGVSVDALPDWVFDFGNDGRIAICGAPADLVATIKAACGGTNASGVISPADIDIDRDAILFALPKMAGLPYIVTGLIAAGALAAAFSTATGLLLAMAGSLAHDGYYKTLDRQASTARRLFVARLFVLAIAIGAAWLALEQTSDVLRVATFTFSLAAAGNFPALVLGIWWKRCTQYGAAAGMAAGLAVTLYYSFMTTWRGMPEWLGVDPVAAGLFGLPVGFAVIVLISLLTPAPSPAVQTRLDRIRTPRGHTIADTGSVDTRNSAGHRSEPAGERGSTA